MTVRFSYDPEAAVAGHWLKFNSDREIIGCGCGFAADLDSDCGWGDSVVAHLIEVGAQAMDNAAADALEQLNGELRGVADRLRLARPSRESRTSRFWGSGLRWIAGGAR